MILILHNLRSGQNVGAIFRIADAAGVEKIYLTGYTPAPRDRFGRPNKEVAKTALGAERYVLWQTSANLGGLLQILKTRTYRLIALEQSRSAVDYKKVKLKEPAAVIVGNEVRGLHSRLLKKCDIIAEIPMRGRKESLNVAVACGIALFRWLDG
jgi:23S rRNA (guanosine2251-2'-O)-methyltransferase